MTMNNDPEQPLGDRMKEYEDVYRHMLPAKRMYVLRVDGKAFHTYTKRFDTPFNGTVIEAMNEVAINLLSGIQGSLIAYVQSDEVSVLFTDTQSENSEAWFAHNIQKIASVGASIATVAFNLIVMQDEPSKLSPWALFDARVFTIPTEETGNYFLWRCQDARRNSLQSLARMHYSHKELHGKNTTELRSLVGEDYDQMDPRKTYGGIFRRQIRGIPTDDGDIVRRKIIVSSRVEENTYSFWDALTTQAYELSKQQIN